MLGLRLSRALALAMALCLAWPASAQTEESDNTTGYNAIIDNIDLLVDNYAKFLARKYDLTEEQDEYTKFLLRERAYEFLEGHEGNLRNLVDRLFDVRTGGEMSQEELIEWGYQAQPIYEEAKKIIIAGNDEWREILTPDQQKIHDEDVKLMHQSFETTEEQLGRIVSGEMTVDEFRSPQRDRRSSRSRTRTTPARTEPDPESDEALARSDPPAAQPLDPPRTTQRRREPPAGPSRPGPQRDQNRAAQPGAAGTGANVHRAPDRSERPRPGTSPRDAQRAQSGDRSRATPESAWEKYVREFITKYQLNDEQTQKANAVLEDCQAQAERYKIGRKEQIERLDKQIEELKESKDKNKAKQLAELTEKRKSMLEPIDQIFERQLKPRLERLPTRAQRRAAEAAAKKPTDKKGKTPPGKRPGKTPAKDDK
jgi:hypothetical protein